MPAERAVPDSESSTPSALLSLMDSTTVPSSFTTRRLTVPGTRGKVPGTVPDALDCVPVKTWRSVFVSVISALPK